MKTELVIFNDKPALDYTYQETKTSAVADFIYILGCLVIILPMTLLETPMNLSDLNSAFMMLFGVKGSVIALGGYLKSRDIRDETENL